MQLHFRMASAAAQARQRAVLRLAEQRRLGVCQHQRESRHEVWPCDRANLGLLEIRQRRIAMVEKCLRIELDLARGSGKSARSSVCAGDRVLGGPCLQTHPDALRRGPKLLQRHPSRRELMVIRSVDIAIPELRRKAE